MKYRIAMWASAGFLIAVGWAVYAFATTASCNDLDRPDSGAIR